MMHQQSPDKLLNGSRFFSVVKTSLQNVLYKSVLIDTGQRANNDLINEFPEHVKRAIFLPKNLKSHFSVKERFSIAYQNPIFHEIKHFGIEYKFNFQLQG